MLNLSPPIHTLRIEKKLLLLCIESSSGSEEGSSDQQMMPEFLNETTSAESKQYMQLKFHKKPYNTALETFKGGM
jgi:hypothetical protein